MNVYLVVFEWSTEDDSDVDIEAYDRGKDGYVLGA